MITTNVALVRFRYGIGVEMDKDYFNIAKKRVEEKKRIKREKEEKEKEN